MADVMALRQHCFRLAHCCISRLRSRWPWACVVLLTIGAVSGESLAHEQRFFSTAILTLGATDLALRLEFWEPPGVDAERRVQLFDFDQNGKFNEIERKRLALSFLALAMQGVELRIDDQPLQFKSFQTGFEVTELDTQRSRPIAGFGEGRLNYPVSSAHGDHRLSLRRSGGAFDFRWLILVNQGVQFTGQDGATDHLDVVFLPNDAREIRFVLPKVIKQEKKREMVDESSN